APSGVFLEVKKPSENTGIGDQVVQAIRDNTDWMKPGGTDHRLVVQSFDEAFLERLNDEYPGIPVGALGGYQRSDFGWLDQINVNHTELTAAEVDRAHEAGAQVSTFVVDDRDRMETMLNAGVDAISTNRPRLLNDALSDRGLDMQHPENDAERESYVGSRWQLTAPDSARLATRVPVSATFHDDTGNPVRWTWVALQTYYSGSWHDIQHRATGRDGTVSTSLWLRRDIKVRWKPWQESPPAAEPSPSRRIDAQTVATVVRLGGRDRLPRGAETQLSVRWHSEDGRPVTGRAALWARPRGADRWHRIRTAKVRDGHRTFEVQPRRTTRFQVRAASGWWWRGDRDSHRVVVRR
ncbi:MAG: glycerophosphodiester phosphodiesterase, partial [Nocardioidaceae bacterium]